MGKGWEGMGLGWGIYGEGMVKGWVKDGERDGEGMGKG